MYVYCVQRKKTKKDCFLRQYEVRMTLDLALAPFHLLDYRSLMSTTYVSKRVFYLIKLGN